MGLTVSLAFASARIGMITNFRRSFLYPKRIMGLEPIEGGI